MEILSAIPRSQKRIGVDKWHRFLVKLRSMEIALPGSRELFSYMQKALCYVKVNMLTYQGHPSEPGIFLLDGARYIAAPNLVI